MTLKRVVPALSAVSLVCAGAFRRPAAGAPRGTVTDPGRAAVPSVSVGVKNVAAGTANEGRGLGGISPSLFALTGQIEVSGFGGPPPVRSNRLRFTASWRRILLPPPLRKTRFVLTREEFRVMISSRPCLSFADFGAGHCGIRRGEPLIENGRFNHDV
jgi:hypothetical protein